MNCPSSASTPSGTPHVGDASFEDHFTVELARSTPEEKRSQLDRLRAFQQRNAEQAPAALKQLQQAALNDGNTFEALMETVRFCSLGQITQALYEVGGKYRRNM